MVKIHIPQQNSTLSRVDNISYITPQRSYIGMSSDRRTCLRKSIYSFRWASGAWITITRRMHDLFREGHRKEPQIINTLKKVCIRVWDTQIELIRCFGHAKGHIDGICQGVVEAPKTTHLLEMKTHNDRSFTKLKAQGVLRSKPQHYDQCQSYMHDLGLSRTLYIGVNKNDNAWYVERIKYDQERSEELLEVERSILFAEELPKRIGGPSWHECKWCEHYDICHRKKPIAKHCRTCQYVEPGMGGTWKCAVYKKEIPKRFQRVGCKKWKLSNIFEG